MTDIDKRKIYDLVNVLTFLKLIRRMKKGDYKWGSIEKCQKNILEIQQRPVQSQENPKSITLLYSCVVSLMTPGAQHNPESIAEHLAKNFPESADKKARKIPDVLKVFVAIGLAASVQDQKQTVVGMEPTNIGRTLAMLESPNRLRRPSLSRTNKKRNVDKLKNIEDFVYRVNPYKLTEEEIALRRKKSTCDYQMIHQMYISSGKVVLPTVRVPLGQTEEEKQV